MKKIMVVASVIMMLIFSSVSVMAADSPTADDYYTITMGSSSSATSVEVDGGTITVSANPVVAGEEVTLTATAKDGYTFVKWAIEGDYTVVEDSGDVLVIIPSGDIDVDAVFESEDGETTTTKTSDDTSSTSPKTGDSATTAAVLLIVACGAAVVLKKKIAE